MTATVAGTFEDRAAAERAVAQLRAAGIPAEEISFIVRDRESPAGPPESLSGVRGGAAATAQVNPTRPNLEPVLTERVRDDTVEPVTPEDYSATETGTATGGLIGALAGLLVGLGTVALPGLGPIVAAGPLAAALGGAALGAATGGLIGALVDAGVPEEYASTYARHVERGHVLLTVRTAAAPQRVRDILMQAGASSVYPASAPV